MVSRHRRHCSSKHLIQRLVQMPPQRYHIHRKGEGDSCGPALSLALLSPLIAGPVVTGRVGADAGRGSADIARSAPDGPAFTACARSGAKHAAGSRTLAPTAAARPGESRTPRATAKAPSTPEARSAAALALSADPVFDEGTYQRIKEALLSYSAIQVRGGWPALPADVKLGPEATGPDCRPAAPASRDLR